MNPKLLPVYLLFVCQLQLFADARANEFLILWSTVSPSGTYALARSKTPSTSEENDKAVSSGDSGTELSIVNIQTRQPALDFSGLEAPDFAPLSLVDDSVTDSFCAWAPREDYLLIVNALDPSACL
jgi:hypothetical protein